jgi:hypothetical protein
MVPPLGRDKKPMSSPTSVRSRGRIASPIPRDPPSYEQLFSSTESTYTSESLPQPEPAMTRFDAYELQAVSTQDPEEHDVEDAQFSVPKSLHPTQ